MNTKIKNILINVEKSGQILPDEKFNTIVESFPFHFPKDYITVMKELNGGEGPIGTDSWLCLFDIEDLEETNKAYTLLMEQIPEYFLIGKDAADTGYAFHKHKGTFHSFGLMSNFETDHIEFLGNDFIEFLDYLENYRYTQ